MEIVHFILSMAVGGGEHLVRVLSQKASVPGIRSRVVCFDRIDAYQDEFSAAGIPLVLYRRRPCVFDHRLVYPLVRMLRKNRVKLIHAHDLSALAYAVAAGRLSGARVMMTEHSRHYIEGAWRRRMEKRWLMFGVSRLVEVSEALKRASIRTDGIPPEKTLVIENGVDVDVFRSALAYPLRETLGIPAGARLILCVGRLEPIKGQRHLIQAMACLGRRDCHLVLVGDGSQSASLRGQARALGLDAHIHFLGARKDIPEFMAACDILVIPSESEGLPFVLLEAMAAGLPVVASRVGEIPGILGRDEYGLGVSPGDTSGLARAIDRTLGGEGRHLAEKGRRLVAAQFSQQRMLNRYETLYRDVLGGRLLRRRIS